MIPNHELPMDELPVGCVNSHFFDSGAFSIWTLAQKYYDENKDSGATPESYYDTDEFYEYLDAYAKFIKKNKVAIDFYANVDAIGFPDITWRNQQYLEKKGIRPVPVVHFKTKLKWLQHYIDRGYDIIGLGGLVGSTSLEGCRRWIDRAFQMVCPAPKYLPTVALHGFGVTTYELLIRYPWYSVDSTSWTKVGAYGGILVPHKRRGMWDYSVPPYVIKVSEDSPDRKKQGKHVLTLSPRERAIVTDWLDFIGVPLGKQDKQGEVLEWGVTTQHTYRKAANLFFFERMRDSLPEWPWPFRSTKSKGFGFA